MIVIVVEFLVMVIVVLVFVVDYVDVFWYFEKYY